jgi:hypothetical protein
VRARDANGSGLGNGRVALIADPLAPKTPPLVVEIQRRYLTHAGF